MSVSPQQRNQIIYLSSKYASNYNNSTYVSDVKFQLTQPITKPKDKNLQVRVAQFVFPVSFYSIDTSNNTLVIDLDGTETTYTISPGNYTATTLVDEILTLIEATDEDYALTYDEVTLKLTFSHPNLTFSILSTSTCLSVLGFTSGEDHDSGVNVTLGNALTSEYPINLAGTKVLYVSLPNLSINNVNANNGNRVPIVVSVPVDDTAGSFCYYTNDVGLTATTQEETISEIHVKILGEDMTTLINFENQDWSMTLELTYV